MQTSGDHDTAPSSIDASLPQALAGATDAGASTEPTLPNLPAKDQDAPGSPAEASEATRLTEDASRLDGGKAKVSDESRARSADAGAVTAPGEVSAGWKEGEGESRNLGHVQQEPEPEVTEEIVSGAAQGVAAGDEKDGQADAVGRGKAREQVNHGQNGGKDGISDPANVTAAAGSEVKPSSDQAEDSESNATRAVSTILSDTAADAEPSSPAKDLEGAAMQDGTSSSENRDDSPEGPAASALDDPTGTPSASTPTVDAEDLLAATEALPAGTPEAVKSASAAALAKKFKATNLSLNKKFLGQSGVVDSKGKATAGLSMRLQALGSTPAASTGSGPRLLTGKIPSSTSAHGSSASGSVAGWAKPATPSPQPNGAPAPHPGTAPSMPDGKHAASPKGPAGPAPRPQIGKLAGSAWGKLGPRDPGARGNLATDFPTAQEVAMNKKMKAQAMAAAVAAREKALQDRAAYNQHLLETLDAFRGTHLDPNASHWDEMEDEDDLFGEVVEFGDGTQYKITEVAASAALDAPVTSDAQAAALAKLEAQHLTGPVSKEERFTDDYDRSRPQPDSAAGTQPPFLRGRSGGDRTLFNERLGRFEPYAGKKPMAPPPSEPFKDVQMLQRTRDEPPPRPQAPPDAHSPERGPQDGPTSPPPRSDGRQLPPHMVDPSRAGQGPTRPRQPSQLDRDAPPHRPTPSQAPSSSVLTKPVETKEPPPRAWASTAAPPLSAATPSAPAAPAPLPPPSQPVEDLDAKTRSEMSSAAERARKRREEEEAAREAERQRARQKALELEAKLKSPPQKAEAVAVPVQSPPSTRGLPPRGPPHPPGLGPALEGQAKQTAEEKRPAPPARDYNSWRRAAPVEVDEPPPKLTDGPLRDARSDPQPRQILGRPQLSPEASKSTLPAPPPGLSLGRQAPPSTMRKASGPNQSQQPRAVSESAAARSIPPSGPPRPSVTEISKPERTPLPPQDLAYQIGSSRPATSRATAPIGSERHWRRAVSAVSGPMSMEDRQLPPHMQGRAQDSLQPPASSAIRPPASAAEKPLSPTSIDAPSHGEAPASARPSLQPKRSSARPFEVSNFDEVMSRIRGAMAKETPDLPASSPTSAGAVPSSAVEPPVLPKPPIYPPPTVKIPNGKLTPHRDLSRATSAAPSPPPSSSHERTHLRRHSSANELEAFSPNALKSTPSARLPRPFPPVVRPMPPDFGLSRTERPPSPPPVWSRYQVKVPTRVKTFREPSPALLARNSINPLRVSVLTWDPPLAGISPRTLSRDDLLLRKKYISGVVVSPVSLPKHRIVRALRPLDRLAADDREGPLVLQGRRRIPTQPKIHLNGKGRVFSGGAAHLPNGVEEPSKELPPDDFAASATVLQLGNVEEMSRQESQESDFSVDSSDSPAKRADRKLPDGSKVGFKSRPLMSEEMERRSSSQRFMVTSEVLEMSPVVPPPAPRLEVEPTPLVPSKSAPLVPDGPGLVMDKQAKESLIGNAIELKGVSTADSLPARLPTRTDPFASPNPLPSLSSTSPWAPSAPLAFSMLDSRSKDVWARPDEQVASNIAPAVKTENSLHGIADDFPTSLPSTLNDFKPEVDRSAIRKPHESDRARDERQPLLAVSTAVPGFSSLASATTDRSTGSGGGQAGLKASQTAERSTSPSAPPFSSTALATEAPSAFQAASDVIKETSASNEAYGYPVSSAYPPGGFQVPPGYQLVPIGSVPQSQQPSYSTMYSAQPSSPWGAPAQPNGYMPQRSSGYSPSPAYPQAVMSPSYSPMAAQVATSTHSSAGYLAYHPSSPPAMPSGYKAGLPASSRAGLHPSALAPQRAPPSAGSIQNAADYGFGTGSRMPSAQHHGMMGNPYQSLNASSMMDHQQGAAAGYAGSFTPFHHMSPAQGPQQSLYSPQAHAAMPPATFSPVNAHMSMGSPYGMAMNGSASLGGAGGSGFFGSGGGSTVPIGAGRSRGTRAVGGGSAGSAQGMGPQPSPYQHVPSSTFTGGHGIVRGPRH